LLDPRLKSLAQKLLPRRVTAWLDPIEEIIEKEVEFAASRTADRDVVLDAGAGEARHRSYFHRGRYVALDAGYGDATWDYSRLDVRGCLERLPLRDGSVDRILCLVVLEHTREPRIVLQEFARAMKPGAALHLVLPFLWEEHQSPHDYHRFTRWGVRLLFEGLPLEVDGIVPLGGFFWLLARRCISLLTFFQGGLRWIAFALLAPFFGFIFPVALYFLDGLDSDRSFSLGFRVRAHKPAAGREDRSSSAGA
jgi:SAM-dependent methyltransferase